MEYSFKWMHQWSSNKKKQWKFLNFPHIQKSKKEYIDKFDEVAICGRPIFNGYEHFIGERAHYDFCNCKDPRLYSDNLLKKLGIQIVINTNNNVLCIMIIIYK